MATINSYTPIILIPSYRPDEKLYNTITQLNLQKIFPIVIVDDGNEAHEEQAIFSKLLDYDNVYIVRHTYNRGKGASLKTGIKYIQKYFPHTIGCVTADADGQHAAEDIIQVANQLILHRSTLILGSRDFNQKNVPLRSSLGNIFTAKLFHFITGVQCPDTQTGLRGIPSSEFVFALSIKGNRFDYEMNYLLNAARRKINFTTLSIETIYINENESSHYNPLKDSLRILRALFKFATTSSIGTIIDLLVFYLLITFIIGNSQNNLIIATIIARILSGTINYYLNLTYIFHGQHSHHTICKYVILFSLLLVTSAFSVAILPALFGSQLLTKILVDTILFFASYSIQQQFVFSGNSYWSKEVN